MKETEIGMPWNKQSAVGSQPVNALSSIQAPVAVATRFTSDELSALTPPPRRAVRGLFK